MRMRELAQRRSAAKQTFRARPTHSLVKHSAASHAPYCIHNKAAEELRTWADHELAVA